MDLQEHMRFELKRALVSRAIFCPVSGDVMDVRTCVTVLDKDGDPSTVLSPAGWDALVEQDGTIVTRLADGGFTVQDPRAVKA